MLALAVCTGENASSHSWLSPAVLRRCVCVCVCVCVRVRGGVYACGGVGGVGGGVYVAWAHVRGVSAGAVSSSTQAISATSQRLPVRRSSSAGSPAAPLAS